MARKQWFHVCPPLRNMVCWEFLEFPPLLGIHARKRFFNAFLFGKGRFGKHGLIVEAIEQSIEPYTTMQYY
jgi:AAA+ ATPase superfamily predicted ATPase